MTYTFQIEYGEDVLLSAGLSQDAFQQEAQFLLAAKLYELGRISSGQAAGLCGKERVPFLLALSDAGVSMCNLREEDGVAELEFIQNG